MKTRTKRNEKNENGELEVEISKDNEKEDRETKTEKKKTRQMGEKENNNNSNNTNKIYLKEIEKIVTMNSKIKKKTRKPRQTKITNFKPTKKNSVTSNLFLFCSISLVQRHGKCLVSREPSFLSN